MKDVKVVTFGEGKVTCNWGTYEGFPAVFIEPVMGQPGVVGDVVPNGFEGDKKGDVRDGGVILQFKNASGMHVLLEDIGIASNGVATTSEATV